MPGKEKRYKILQSRMRQTCKLLVRFQVAPNQVQPPVPLAPGFSPVNEFLRKIAVLTAFPALENRGFISA